MKIDGVGDRGARIGRAADGHNKMSGLSFPIINRRLLNLLENLQVFLFVILN